MNKSELVTAIASRAKLTKAAAARALDAFLEVVEGELRNGEKVSLVGFGTFQVVKRKARTGVDPRTRKKIKIKAKKVVKFKAGKRLAEAVN